MSPQTGSLLPEGNTLLWCRAACARLLQPVVRLALRFGLKHADLDLILREELIAEARRQAATLGKEGKPNVSQLSVITGLQRKEITERLQQQDQSSLIEQTERSWSSRVFTAWLSWVAENPLLRSLPTVSPSDTPDYPSFANLSRQVSKGNVHHRTVLNELLRLQLVEETEHTVTLRDGSFIPREDQKLLLAFAGDNGRDHLLAIVGNVSGRQPPFLEQAVFSENIAPADCVAVNALTKAHWQQLQQTLISYLTDAENQQQASPVHPVQRLRVGIYVYHEQQSEK